MKINYWLCKVFDVEDKGYVTVGDIFNSMIPFGVCCFFAVAVLYGNFLIIKNFNNLNEYLYYCSIIDYTIFVLTLCSDVVFILTFGYDVLKYVSKLKVAKRG